MDVNDCDGPGLASDAVAGSLHLTSSPIWVATPDNYASLRNLTFDADGTGEATYGYGQTIYAVVPFRWRTPRAGRLRFDYQAVARGRLARSFVLDEIARVRELVYRLVEGETSGVDDVVGLPFSYTLTLELSEPPWPPGLNLPYDVPRVFYGRRKAPPDD